MENSTTFKFQPTTTVWSRDVRKEASENLYFAHFKVGVGYATVALVKSLSQNFTAWAVAFCNPEDQFNRQIGRTKARTDLFLCLARDERFFEHNDLFRRPCLITFDEEIFHLPRHESCEAALQAQLLTRKPSWFGKKDKIEPVTRGRAKKRLGNLKTDEETI